MAGFCLTNKSRRSNSHFDFAICNNNLPKSKRSQAWGIDLVIASIIFVIGIVIFYFYALNEPGEAEENIESLFYDGKIIADSILSEGYPKDWNSTNVVTIGILSENKINETKLERFYNLTGTDPGYARTRALFNTKYNYYFSLSETMTFSFGDKAGIGRESPNPKNLVKITRFVIYKNKPMTAYLHVWEE